MMVIHRCGPSFFRTKLADGVIQVVITENGQWVGLHGTSTRISGTTWSTTRASEKLREGDLQDTKKILRASYRN